MEIDEPISARQQDSRMKRGFVNNWLFTPLRATPQRRGHVYLVASNLALLAWKQTHKNAHSLGNPFVACVID